MCEPPQCHCLASGLITILQPCVRDFWFSPSLVCQIPISNVRIFNFFFSSLHFALAPLPPLLASPTSQNNATNNDDSSPLLLPSMLCSRDPPSSLLASPPFSVSGVCQYISKTPGISIKNSHRDETTKLRCKEREREREMRKKKGRRPVPSYTSVSDTSSPMV